MLIHDDETFEGIIYAGKVTRNEEFQSCTFKNCDLSNSSFIYNKFLDCTFIGCNLSLVHLGYSTLNNAVFKSCKILGVNFKECQDFLFSVQFENCILDYASFMDKKMPKTKFINSSLKEVNFSNTMLSGSLFDQTDLSGTVFNRTDLTAANFVTAYNFDIDPELNNVKKAAFSTQGLQGLLLRHQLKVV
ncbi:MAG: pentapeptide repeat-containing protein [Mucilaginibacter sp.]